MTSATRLYAGLRPDATLTVDEWADLYRVMTTAESPLPGQWRTDVVPFAREPMRLLSAGNPCPRVVLMFPSQVVKTEVAINWFGYTVDVSPCPLMLLQPTERDCEALSKQRIKHLLESPRLRGKVADPKARDSGNTILLKEYAGGVLYMVGANSPAGLAGKPMGRLHADEPDRYPASAAQEGDPLDLARKRLSAWGSRSKELVTGTPVLMNGPIHREYLAGSQGTWEVPCPHCGEYQPLAWEGLHWAGDPAILDGFRSWYECAHCHAETDETAKGAMLARGRFTHAHPDRTVRSFTMTALAAPVGGVAWRTLVGEWLTAQARSKRGDNEGLKVFLNTRLAQPWEDLGEQVDAGTLERRAEAWSPDAIPAGVRVITAFSDVHDDRLEVEVVGWGAGLESWSLGYYVIPTDPLDRGTWEALDDVRRRVWVVADGRRLTVAACGVDSGFRTQAVRDYCTARRRERVFATKGLAGRGVPIWDRKVRRGGKDKNLGRFHLIGVDTAKDAVASYLRINAPGPGYCHIPAGRDPAWFAGMASEHRVKETVKVGRNRGREVWTWRVKSAEERKDSGGSARNESWDCRVGNLAMVHCLLSAGLVLPAAETSPLPAPVEARPTAAPPAPQSDLDISEKISQPKPAPPVRQKPTGDWWARQRAREEGRGYPY